MFKRVVAVLLILVSVVVFLGSLAGAVGVWFVQRSLRDAATRTFADADRALGVTARSVAVVEDGLRNARTDLAAIKITAVAPAGSGMKPGFFDRLVSQALADRLGPKVGQVNETVNMAADAAVVMNSLLGGLSQLPESSISALDTERLGKVHDSLADFTQSSQQLSALLQQSAPDGNAGDLAQTTARMEELLEVVLAWAAEFKVKVAGVQADVSTLRSRALNWIRVGPIVLTAIFAWIAISQLGLIAYLRSWFRSV